MTGAWRPQQSSRTPRALGNALATNGRIKTHAKRREGIAKLRVIAIDHVLWRYPFSPRSQHDGHAMLIRATDEDQVFAKQAPVAAIDIRGQVGTRQVADVQGPIGIGKRCGDQRARKGARRHARN